ncbi:MAG TPA: phospholipid carrier-dependent glycosyltransferase [Terriglobales bacterium]
MTDRTRLTVLEVAVATAVCAFLFFFGLGAFGLVGADEPRYAQIAREMLARHDWIVPTLNGTPWLEKPIFLYWKVMASFRFLGVEDWAARLPAAFHATIMVLCIFFFVRRFRPGSELDAALIAASSAGVIAFARAASTDMLLSATFSVALLCWWTWRQNGRRLWLAIFYVLLGFGVLAKGPVAPALAVLIVAAYSLLHRDARVFSRSLWLPGLGLFAVVVMPWYVAIQMKVPTFYRVFFIEHNLERFGTNLYRHSQPFWYYIPVFLLATLPWVCFTIPALVDAARDLWKRIRAGSGASYAELAAAPTPLGLAAASPINNNSLSVESAAVPDDLPVFLFVWITVPVVFFSISRSKLPGYILPAIPPVAVLAADYIHRRPAFSRIQVMLHSLLSGAIMAVALLVPWRLLREPVPERTRNLIAVISGVIAVAVLLMIRKRGRRLLYLATLLPVVLAMAFLLKSASTVLDGALSERALSAGISERMRQLGVAEHAPVAVFNVKREVAYGLDFYRNQSVGYYEGGGPSDLSHGVPAGEHVVVAPEGSLSALEAVVAPRQVLHLGGYPPQHLEFFLVSK